MVFYGCYQLPCMGVNYSRLLIRCRLLTANTHCTVRSFIQSATMLVGPYLSHPLTRNMKNAHSSNATPSAAPIFFLQNCLRKCSSAASSRRRGRVQRSLNILRSCRKLAAELATKTAAQNEQSQSQGEKVQKYAICRLKWELFRGRNRAVVAVAQRLEFLSHAFFDEL